MAEVSKFNWNYQQAIAGNPDAIDYMYEYVNANYKYANQLLYKLEREKIINHTYRVTADFLQEEMGTWKARFKLSMLTDENVADVAKELNRFLGTKTSRVGAARRRWAQQQANIELMRSAGWNIPTDPEKLERINNVLDGDFYYSLTRDFKYQIMDKVAQAFENGFDEQKIKILFDRYASGEIEYEEFGDILKGK